MPRASKRPLNFKVSLALLMMENLPVDTSHPAVRDYLSLVRLQVLTPLSLLINIATVAVCAFMVNPSIAGVSKLYPTSITPNPAAIGVYVAVLYLGQIGYCLLLVMVSKSETKKTMVKGVGFALVLANIVMALWAIAWILEWFLLSTILQGILLLLLVYSNIALLIYHPPVSSRPIDTALIHAPLRFFLILPLSILFALSLFVTLGLTADIIHPGAPRHWHAMAGFGVVIGTNLLGLVVIIIRRDIVWCIASTWIAVSIWTARPKPPPVFITAITFTALHPLGLFASLVYDRFYGSSRRGVVLPPGDDHPGLYSQRRNRHDGEEIDPGPREVDDAAWG